MNGLIILGLALSASIDNLGVGITYGIRKIRIGFSANLLIAVICFLFSAAGIYMGKWAAVVMPGIWPVLLGAILLSFIGIRIILLAIPRQPSAEPVENSENPTPPKGWRGILQNPEQADMDRSGHIGWGEAVILGIALSANALTGGLGAGLMGFSPLAISLVTALASFVTVWLGVALGSRVAHIRIGPYSVGQFGTLLSGVLLVLIAVNSLL
jgi:putative sporulation protein YtaF